MHDKTPSNRIPWCHVMNRVRRGEKIFGNTDDFERFIALLQEVAEMFTLRVSVFCLMPNHYHILEQTPQANELRNVAVYLTRK